MFLTAQDFKQILFEAEFVRSPSYVAAMLKSDRTGLLTIDDKGRLALRSPWNGNLIPVDDGPIIDTYTFYIDGNV